SVRGSRDADPSQASSRSSQGPGAHRRARSDLGGAAEDVAHRSVAERDPTAASSLAASAAARYTLRSAMDSRLERWATVAAVLGLFLSSCHRAPAPPAARRPPSGRSVRITMDALHRAGGVPPGWRLTPPAGDVASGRRLVAD